MKGKLLVIDTETGGLDPEQFSIFSLGAVVIEDGKLGNEFYSLICEEYLFYSQKALRVNGLSVKKIKNEGISVEQARLDFSQFLADNELFKNIMLVGHNVKFDIGFLKRLFRYPGGEEFFDEKFDYHSLDTIVGMGLLKFAGYFPNLQKLNLDSCLSCFDLKRETDKHNALEDAKLAAKLFIKIIETIEKPAHSSIHSTAI